MSPAAALVLAVVFLWAAVAKVRDRAGTAASFRGLGLPAPAALAVAVPVVEVALAVGLVVRPSIAGWLALALLVAFTLVIAGAIARGVEVGCACFGSAANDRPVSTLEVVRNAGLAALAVVATGASGDALWPALPAIVIVTVVVALGRVGLAMAELRMAGGHVFSTPLPGEHRR
jgi:uncharacterized membrane protein YphA (DoxX/SURF4 family)